MSILEVKGVSYAYEKGADVLSDIYGIARDSKQSLLKNEVFTS